MLTIFPVNQDTFLLNETYIENYKKRERKHAQYHTVFHSVEQTSKNRDKLVRYKVKGEYCFKEQVQHYYFKSPTSH